MTKDAISRGSWLAVAGLCVALLSGFVGLIVGSSSAHANDGTVTRSVLSGTMVGVVLGGLLLGAIVARDRELGAIHWTLWVLTPGTFIGLPLLGSALLNRDLAEGAKQCATLVIPSGLAAELSARLVRWARRG